MRCKCCKEKFIPKKFLQKFCMEKDECIKAFTEFAREKNKKEQVKNWNKQKQELKVNTHSKEHRRDLQTCINKLSRMIDEKFGFITCIDCDRNFGKQIDACHFHGRGGNNSLRYNLDNLHSGRSDCNQFSDTHKQGYILGLEKRYGDQYKNYVVNELPLKYREIHLNNKEAVEKLTLVRKLIRDFDTFVFENSIQARKGFNTLIGIYK